MRTAVGVILVLFCCNNIVFAVGTHERGFHELLHGEIVNHVEKIEITADSNVKLADDGSVSAASEEEIINLTDMKYVVLDDSQIVIDDNINHSRATISVSWTVPVNTLKRAKETFPMEVGESVTINCSYTPRGAEVDFGLIAPNNRFYYIAGSQGSINRTILIDERGEYRFAVCNNSSNTISVTGFIEY